MILNYDELPRRDRQAAKHLAKKLLQTTPAAPKPNDSSSLRGLLLTAFMKPENVVAAFVYSDGKGNWWGDIVLRKGDGLCQIGVPDSEPCRSKEEAFDYLKSNVAMIKAACEVPLIAQLRSRDIDPESVNLLRVHHAQLGDRYLMRFADQIPSEAERFGRIHGLDDASDGLAVRRAVSQARNIALQYAFEFSGDLGDSKVVPLARDAGESTVEVQLVRDAVSFLISLGILNIDDRDSDKDGVPAKSEPRESHGLEATQGTLAIVRADTDDEAFHLDDAVVVNVTPDLDLKKIFASLLSKNRGR